MSTSMAKRGPGRPRKEQNMSNAAAPTRPDAVENRNRMAISREEQERIRRERREGVGTVGYRLQIPKEKLQLDRFAYRWMSDEEARVYSVTHEGGWAFVHQNGTEIKDDAEMGSAINVVAGKKKDGSPLRQYLMRKPKEWWNEDQRQRAEQVEDVFAEMNRGNDPDGARHGSRTAPSRSGTYVLDENSL